MSDTIRIRLHTHASGPHLQLAPGVHDVDREQAEDMLAGGFAERIEQETSGALAETVEAEPQPTAEEEGGSDAWTATAEEAKAEEEPAVHETATSGPQRAGEADDVLAAEVAGRDAARDGKSRSDNPYDRRTTLGKAWYRGWDGAQT